MSSLAEMRRTLEKAKLHALVADRKAKASGDPLDYAAAEMAWSQAANAAHLIGIESDVPKADRDKNYQLGVKLNKIADERKKQGDQIRQQAYRERHERWSSRDKLVQGAPPTMMNVLDSHGGFTAVTKSQGKHERELGGLWKTTHPKFSADPTAWLHGDTVWRPGDLLKKTTNGTLVVFEPKSFYQTNSDVTKALYSVPGYRYPVAVWFDNTTGKRIA